MKKIEIVFIDDNLKETSPTLIRLRKNYNVSLHSNSNEGLDYVLNNNAKKIIVVLDIGFPFGEDSGDQILLKIRKTNKLIPVIIWSALRLSEELAIKFINNQTLYFIPKTKHDELRHCIDAAAHRINIDVATNIELWLEQQNNKDQTLFISSTGKSMSANDLIHEIRMETQEGRDLEADILQLTVDLLFRGKEEI